MTKLLILKHGALIIDHPVLNIDTLNVGILNTHRNIAKHGALHI